MVKLFEIPNSKRMTGAVMVDYPQYHYPRLPEIPWGLALFRETISGVSMVTIRPFLEPKQSGQYCFLFTNYCK